MVGVWDEGFYCGVEGLGCCGDFVVVAVGEECAVGGVGVGVGCEVLVDGLAELRYVVACLCGECDGVGVVGVFGLRVGG